MTLVDHCGDDRRRHIEKPGKSARDAGRDVKQLGARTERTGQPDLEPEPVCLFGQDHDFHARHRPAQDEARDHAVEGCRRGRQGEEILELRLSRGAAEPLAAGFESVRAADVVLEASQQLAENIPVDGIQDPASVVDGDGQVAATG